MLTKLQALNRMLTAVGETTVLVRVDGAGDLANAEVVLDAETLAVLATGWRCNTDAGVLLPVASGGKVAVPTDALLIDATDSTRDLVPRGGFLWDRGTNTDVLGAAVRVNVIRSLAFEAVPYVIQQAIVARAARVYQRDYVGSEEADARLKAAAEDAESAARLADVTEPTVTRLDAETRRLLARGWHFNTDVDFEIAPDSQGRIPVPANALQIDPMDPALDYVKRGGFLWDRGANTFAIGKAVKCKVVRSLPFADLPFALQQQVEALARIRQRAELSGDKAALEIDQASLTVAVNDAADAEAETDDYNILDNADIAWFRRRTGPRLV